MIWAVLDLFAAVVSAWSALIAADLWLHHGAGDIAHSAMLGWLVATGWASAAVLRRIGGRS